MLPGRRSPRGSARTSVDGFDPVIDALTPGAWPEAAVIDVPDESTTGPRIIALRGPPASGHRRHSAGARRRIRARHAEHESGWSPCPPCCLRRPRHCPRTFARTPIGRACASPRSTGDRVADRASVDGGGARPARSQLGSPPGNRRSSRHRSVGWPGVPGSRCSTPHLCRRHGSSGRRDRPRCRATDRPRSGEVEDASVWSLTTPPHRWVPSELRATVESGGRALRRRS